MNRQSLSPKNRIVIQNSRQKYHLASQNPLNDSFGNEQKQLLDFQQYSFNDKAKTNNQVKLTRPRKKSANFIEVVEAQNNFIEKTNKKNLQMITLNQLARKLQKASVSIFQSQYGNQFSMNRDNLLKISKVKIQENFDKMILFYTNAISQIVKTEQLRIKAQSSIGKAQQKLITLNKEQRVKLKLIVSTDTENNGFGKKFEGYIHKIEEEAERHKKEYVQVRQKNRMMQNQMLKLSLEFKNKRQLYLNEIARLTEILHSSFMEVGKKFINHRNEYNNFHTKTPYARNEIYAQQAGKRSFIHPIESNFNRKNIKSLSPKNDRAQSSGYHDLKNSLNQPDLKGISRSINKNTFKTQAAKGSIYKNMEFSKNFGLNKRQNSQKAPFDAVSEPQKGGKSKLSNSVKNEPFLSTVMAKKNTNELF